jgi:drug/metabolite transporter superfamily protein YnfA
MGSLFNNVMKVVSTLLGVVMIAFGGIWILQGLGIAFQVGFMAGDPAWAVYGAILALVGVGQVIWSVTRR